MSYAIVWQSDSLSAQDCDDTDSPVWIHRLGDDFNMDGVLASYFVSYRQKQKLA